MQRDRESSPRLQAKKLESPTSLTEFAPLSPEVKPQSSPFSFSRLFRRNKSQKESTPSEGTPATSDDESYKQSAASLCKETHLPPPLVTLPDDLPQCETDSSCGPSSTSSCTDTPSVHISSVNSPEEGQGRNIDLLYGRSMTNVLKRIANLLDKKNSTLQDYKDSEFKQYWMPDSNCKECYECGEKFTTFRRRHHCRICGQIFCRRCCNQAIPGKVMGCTGDLRVCTYCCKVVLSYVQTLDASTEISGDVRALQDDLQQKLSVLTEQADTCIVPDNGVKNTMRRKSSVMGFREEEIAKAKPLSRTDVTEYTASEITALQAMSPERRAIAKDTVVLQQLWAQIQNRVNGIDFQNHRCRLRTYANCIVGSELVDWLVNQEKASSRAKAIIIGQALLDAKILECVISHEQLFVDGFVLYRPGEGSKLENLVLPVVHHNTTGNQEGQEPLWVKEIQATAEVETDGSAEVSEQMVHVHEEIKSPSELKRMSSSNSTFCLSLDIKESRVRVSRPSYASPPVSPLENSIKKNNSCPEVMPTPHDVTSHAREFYESQISAESINTETTGDFLRAALSVDPLNSHLQDEVNIRQDWHSVQQLQEDNGEKLAFERLNASYDTHEQALLRQLLSQEGLSLSWCDIILPIIHRVTDTVHPDVKNDNDDMDIRQYVQFKKIPGGSKSECTIVSGVVFTKNVAHKRMRQNLFNPTILLLSSSIVYQRVENKLSSLEPIIMQEYEYLKNAVAKVTVYKPDVLLVEKTVSRLAQEMLLSMGVTVILNVKTSVMERVARCTQAAVVNSIDAHLGRPQLGTCHHFRVNTFHLPGYKTKNLVFFDGCPANLGCTILLRGGSGAELKKVKSITQFMVYVAYNWRLERSFLMDAFAMPPSASDEMSLIADNTCDEERLLKDVFERHHSTNDSDNRKSKDNSVESIEKQNSTLTKETKPQNRTLNLNLKNSSNTENKTMECTEESSKKLESVYIEDFSDPLRSYLQSEDNTTFQNQESTLQVDSLPVSNRFRKALDDVILCCSPNIDVCLPYLETEPGRNCELRHFFPEEIYWSEQFSKEGEISNKWISLVDSDEVSLQSSVLNVNQDTVELFPPHKFISYKIIDHTSNVVQSLVADFRARGRTVKRLCPHERMAKEKEKKLKIDLTEVASGQSLKSSEVQPATGLCWEKQVDALSPYNHQRLSVLFCSYSCTSNNAPNFCVSPWVVRMDFYGSNDITLGGFLERYCFRSSYMCPSPTCDTPMTEHVRKFVHENGCVHILLHKLETSIQATESNIFTWSWCCMCKQASRVVLLSQDTWSLSFAKYLELRFHGSQYGRRGVSEHCSHSLNHDHHHYFAHKQLVATFKYTPVTIWEVALPPPVIVIQDFPIPSEHIVDKIKVLAVKGTEIYSSVWEKLCTLEEDYQDTIWEEIVTEMISLQKIEMAAFREKIEEIQLKLTSPTLENKQMAVPSGISESKENKEVCNMMWKIFDSVVLLKRHVAEAVYQWNARIQEFVAARKKEEKFLPKLVSQTSKIAEPSSNDQTYQADASNKRSNVDPEVRDLENIPSVEGEPLKHNTEEQPEDVDMEKLGEKKLEDAFTGPSDSNEVSGQVNEPCRSLVHSISTDSQHSQKLSWRERSLSMGEISTLDDEDSSLMIKNSINSSNSSNNRNDDFNKTNSSYSKKPTIQRVNSEPSHVGRLGTTALSRSSQLQQKEDYHRTLDALDKLRSSENSAASKQLDVEQKLCSSGSSTSSYTYGVSPGIYAGLMVPEAEESESYVVCHRHQGEEQHGHPSNRCIGMRGHERSKSDGADRALENRSPRSSFQIKSGEEESLNSKPDKRERTLQTLLSQLISTTPVTPIQSPFPPYCHVLLPRTEKVPILVYDQEPSSIIAYALSSAEYEQQLQELRMILTTGMVAFQRDSQSSSPLMKRRHTGKSLDGVGTGTDGQAMSCEGSPNHSKKPGMLSFFRGYDRSSVCQKASSNVPLSFDAVHYSVGRSEKESMEGDEVDFPDFTFCSSQDLDKGGGKGGVKPPNFHIELQFSDAHARFYCRVYFAEQFRKLRCLLFPEGEERHIRSLSRCIPWVAKGGKSGSTFCKTSDDRFILKQMPRTELQSFLEFAPHYFQYINKACVEQKPTVLAKIVGVYRIGYKNTLTNTASKMDLLVMENLFYGRNIIQKFDLKGSVRNRLVNTTGQQEDDIVLLDENLLKMTCDCPLYIRPHSKTVLTLAINNDVQFLASQSVIDYSLLVGLDDDKKELVVGIIDYIRLFTWDKKMEMLVKSSGLLGGHGKMPTVVSPEVYRVRFCEAMDGYFLWVPDRWSGLGKGVDC